MTRRNAAQMCARRAQAWLIVSALLVPLSGCGYRLLRPGEGGDASPIRLGEIEDLSTEGDLGLVAGEALRAGLIGRASRSSTAPRLTGVVAIVDDRPLGYDSVGVAQVYQVSVRLTVSLVDDLSEALRWHEPGVTVSRPYLRGPNPQETHGARRIALTGAVSEAVEEVVARLQAIPAGEESR